MFLKGASDSVHAFVLNSPAPPTPLFLFPVLEGRCDDWSYSSHFIINNEGEAKEITEILALTSLSCLTVPGIPVFDLCFQEMK